MSPNSIEINLALLTLSGLVLLMGIFSNPMRARLWLSEPLIALAAGVFLSPAGLSWIRLSELWRSVLDSARGGPTHPGDSDYGHRPALAQGLSVQALATLGGIIGVGNAADVFGQRATGLLNFGAARLGGNANWRDLRPHRPCGSHGQIEMMDS